MPTGLLVLLAIGTVLWFARALHRGDDAFAPTRGFPALYLTWFALGSMNVVRPDAGVPLWNPISAGLWGYVVAGLAAYAVACTVLRSGPLSALAPRAWRDAVASWHHRRALLVGGALLLLLGASYALLARQGALALLAADPGSARVQWTGGRVVWSVYHSVLLAYVPLALLYAWSHPAVTTALRRWIYATIGLLFGMTLLFANRSLVFEPAMLAFLTFHYARRRVTLRLLTVGALVSVLFLSLGGMYRDVRQYGPSYIAMIVGWGFPVWSLPVTYIYTYIRDPVLTFDRLRRVVPAFQDYTHGSLHALPVAAALPGHQESPDLVFKRLLHSDFGGFGQPATLLGHLYVDGGWIAIVAGMYLFGLISGLVYARMQRAPTPYRVLLHIWVAHVALWSLFTSLIPAITTLFVPLFLFGLVALVSTGRRLTA